MVLLDSNKSSSDRKKKKKKNNKYHMTCFYTYMTLFACISMLNIYRGDLESFTVFSRVFADIYLLFVRFYAKISIIKKDYI